MRTGKINYYISEETKIIAEYEIKDKEMIITLTSPYRLDCVISYDNPEEDENFDRGYAQFELNILIQKLFIIKEHKKEFDRVMQEFRKAETHIKKERGSSLDLIGIFHSLLEKHLENINDVELYPFWIDPELLADILLSLD